MDQDALFAAIVAIAPGEGDLLYVERRGETYAMTLTPPGGDMPFPTDTPDAWIFWSAKWPDDSPDQQRAVFADLLAEMETMAGGADRCHWIAEPPGGFHSH